MRDLEMTHGQLNEALSLSQDFFAGNGEDPKELIVEPMTYLAEKLATLPGYMGFLGVGHPFYAVDQKTDKVLPVPSINAYHEEQKARVEESAAQHGDYWPCANCQVVNKLPNLTDQCNPCELVSFKPRDLFRVLPDMDALAVFQGTSEELEGKVQEVLLSEGWVRFNTDIKGAFDNTVSVLSGNATGRLPIDFHILTFQQLEEAFQKFATDPLGPQIGTMSRAWRARWKDQPVDISYSFIFSMTTIGLQDDNLEDLLTSTRRAVIENATTDELTGMVERSRRCGPILGSLSLRDLMYQRIERWSDQ